MTRKLGKRIISSVKLDWRVIMTKGSESVLMTRGLLRRTVVLYLSMAVVSSLLLCADPGLQQAQSVEKDVMLFCPPQYGNANDLSSYKELAGELRLSTKEVDYGFMNKRESFFDRDGHPRFKVLIIPGGEPSRWFEQTVHKGLNCQGVSNILDFTASGGSVIAICICGSSLFVRTYEKLAPSLEEAQRGEWDKTHRIPGYFRRFCGLYAFAGIVRGPQETNRPFPKMRFLPITMNPENDIVRDAGLPPVIYQMVVGGGSLIPDPGQPLEAVGWYPNGTVAIGVVPYGRGRIILSNPHPNITGQRVKSRNDQVLGDYAKRWGWTEQMIAEERKAIQAEGDPDGPEPDWRLARAMLWHAYRKALR
jgi:hypothetical protein